LGVLFYIIHGLQIASDVVMRVYYIKPAAMGPSPGQPRETNDPRELLRFSQGSPREQHPWDFMGIHGIP